MQIPRRKSDALKKWDDGPVYLTEEGFIHLKEKLARLKVALPGFIIETKRTAEYGDRSDSAEYKDAKSTSRRTYWQILTIQEQIKRVVIIKSGPNASGVIQLGSTVVLDVNGARKTFQVVGPRETNPTNGRISHESPLGAALLNRKQGDVIRINLPSGGEKDFQEYCIIEIK